MEKAYLKTVDDFENFYEEFIEQDRRGVIELPVPMLNINEWHGAPLYYALALGITKEQFEKIAYYSEMVVKESTIEGFKDGEIISAEKFAEYETLPAEVQEKVSVIGGAEAIAFLLGRLDVDADLESERKLEIALMQKKESLYERYDDLGGDDASWAIWQKEAEDALKVGESGEGAIGAFLTEGEQALIDTEAEIDDINNAIRELRCLITALERLKKYGTDNLIIHEVELFPLDIRGALKEMAKEIPYAIYDIESAYCKVAMRADRVKNLMDMGAPDIILRNEKRMLQETLDALIHNGARGHMPTDAHPECKAASLTDIMLRRAKLV